MQISAASSSSVHSVGGGGRGTRTTMMTSQGAGMYPVLCHTVEECFCVVFSQQAIVSHDCTIVSLSPTGADLSTAADANID